MYWIEKGDYMTARRHALHNRQGVGAGITWCGRTLTDARTGGCIPDLISCGSCKRLMRLEGWRV